ncbi:MAG TPA: hypothetical protein VI685_18875 [Candidatus Angelobacter sp.]
MRVETRRPKQPVTWIPAVLELFKQKAQVTSQEVATVVGKTLGGDAVTRCRQLGLPLEAAGFLNGNRLPRKLYTLNTHLLWLALEEAVQQINRYALLFNSREGSSDCRTFRNLAIWMEHVQRLLTLKQSQSTKRNSR